MEVWTSDFKQKLCLVFRSVLLRIVEFSLDRNIDMYRYMDTCAKCHVPVTVNLHRGRTLYLHA